MVDIPGNSSTTSSIRAGESLNDQLEAVGDHDWVRIDLVAGQSIRIVLTGSGTGPLDDPFLRLRDADGTLIQEDDDSGPGLGSAINFTADATGTYYIDIGAYADQAAGTYQLSVTPFDPNAPLPIYSLDQIAQQLTTDYWGQPRSWNVRPGGELTVNITGLTAEGQFFATNALSMWSDVIGVRFRQVDVGGQIIFDDNADGASTSSSVSGGTIVQSRVNIATSWITSAGTNLYSYAFQTYLHEIGHALGLGHGGDYNGEAAYPTDALYQNDSWPNSVMSYFDQNENTYFRDLGFTRNYVLSPQIADVLAMSKIYGLSTTTRSGDTTYGFNSTADRTIFNASLFPRASYTIIDSGGVDTLDFSGFTTNQTINLNPGNFSSVGSNVGNLSIALGTVIENVVGGSGSDTIVGNAANNQLTGGLGNDIINGGGGDDVITGGGGVDQLTGGAGADTFFDTTSGLNGDTIVDFGTGDRIVFSNATQGSFAFNLSGTTLSFTGGSLTLANYSGGQLSSSVATGGGVQLLASANTVVVPPVRSASGDAATDFNGDGRSDLVLQSSTGAIGIWRGQANGALVEVGGLTANALDASWRVVGTGDFNGDGRDDILWRHSSGVIGEWSGQVGVFTNNSGVAANAVDNSWFVAGVADFNGDGRDDILWRHSSGEIGQWLAQPNGSFSNNGGAAANLVDPSWTIVATGDFNGDGRADVLWRHVSGVYAEWQGSATGKLNNSGGVMAGATGTVVGSGDFNGDGRDDILMRNAATGQIIEWLGQANGQFSSFTPSRQLLDLSWKVVAIGDYNGDGRDDLIWKHVSGEASEWLGQANSDFAYNGTVPSVPSGWTVQSPDIFLV